MPTKRSTKQKIVQPVRQTEVIVATEPEPAATPPSQERRPMPWFGWLGLGILVLSEIALTNDFHPAAVVFTPIMWTGYILFLDGWIWARGHKSYFIDKKWQWPMLALFSVLIWVMFESFNFKVQAWEYYNRPEPLLRNLIFIWAFATIIPAMLRTRSLFGTFELFHQPHPWNIRFTPFLLGLSFVVGIAFTFMPLMFSDKLANLLIPFVWVGLIFLIEPINYRLGTRSVFRDLENGKISFLLQMLAAGLFCGILWETWNEQAKPFNGLFWKYFIADIYHTLSFNLKWGEMPLIGFLGYPPFIWECFALWELCKWALQEDHLLKTGKA